MQMEAGSTPLFIKDTSCMVGAMCVIRYCVGSSDAMVSARSDAHVMPTPHGVGYLARLQLSTADMLIDTVDARLLLVSQQLCH
ncbi:hypothetical protein C5167_049621 [Papaver somniferum]|uniref:Uncharacterized protein n=1 Tax=Papaver somniferum TaxID=3469 RepID=A0A4Y7KPT9_PAPSO|nr:hypothetical protein C5167_049621 [Papaver somniferum]